jgi:adenine phosphoribosyltransferase
MNGLAQRLRPLVRDVPDHPEPGITFRDITPLLADPIAFAAVVDALAQTVPDGAVDVVAGMEARGFILGAPVARRLGVGFVPIRKAGKLPWRTVSASYALEYGEATLELHEDAFSPGQRVLLVDDVLATGGTAVAAAELVHRAGARVAGIGVLIELVALGGRDRASGLAVEALLQL